MVIQRFERNPYGRDFIVGDIHGAYSSLRARLEMIGFNARCDRLFCTGDLVDRGPESDQVLEWLAQPWFASVKGNHERLCEGVASRRFSPLEHVWNGGEWFAKLTDIEREPYLDAFAELPIAIELETADGLVGIIHADCVGPRWDYLYILLGGGRAETAIEFFTWSRRRFQEQIVEDIIGVRAVVVGHQNLDRMTRLGNVLCIDTGGAYDEGHFTVLDATTLKPARIRGKAGGAGEQVQI